MHRRRRERSRPAQPRRLECRISSLVRAWARAPAVLCRFRAGRPQHDRAEYPAARWSADRCRFVDGGNRSRGSSPRGRHMRNVAVVIAASPTPAFYSQVAVLNLALKKLPWSGWQPRLHMYLGGGHDPAIYEAWRPHLGDVNISWTDPDRYERDGDWAQSDDVFRFAPRDADVVLAMDADTFPVRNLEPVLDQIVATNAIGGVIAHYPLIVRRGTEDATSSLPQGSTDGISTPAQVAWKHLTHGVIEA